MPKYQTWYGPSGGGAADSGAVPTRQQERDAARRRRELAERVRALRQEKGWTQEQLAYRAGFDRKSVNRIENAAYSPSADRLFVLADALGVAVSDLVAGIA